MSADPLERTLTEAFAGVVTAMRKEVADLPESVRPVIAHHLGWRGPADPEGGLGGKGVRAGLVLLSATAAGAPPTIAIPGAVAVEMIHNFSLLHDDVMDGDELRRHRPASWVLFGESRALLAGSALLARSHTCLLSSPSGPAALRCIERSVQDLLQGQALDLELESTAETNVGLWLRMAEGKTAALLAASAALGAVLADAPPQLVADLSSFGRATGLAYQAVDDLLGIWGDTQLTGKPAGSDLRQGKKTLPLIAALERGGSDAAELLALLQLPIRGEGEVARMTALVERAGGGAATEAAAAKWVAEAEDAATSSGIPPSVSRRLCNLANDLGKRQR